MYGLYINFIAVAIVRVYLHVHVHVFSAIHVKHYIKHSKSKSHLFMCLAVPCRVFKRLNVIWVANLYHSIDVVAVYITIGRVYCITLHFKAKYHVFN